jgi:hypothetical protein
MGTDPIFKSEIFARLEKWSADAPARKATALQK